MTTTSIIEQHIHAFNARNEHDEPWAENAHMVAPGGAEPAGRESVLAFLRVFHNAFSDARLTIDVLVVEGTRAAVEGTFTGTHDGALSAPGGDVPATGNAITFRWAAVYETTETDLVSEHLYFDQADFLAQLGVR